MVLLLGIHLARAKSMGSAPLHRYNLDRFGNPLERHRAGFGGRKGGNHRLAAGEDLAALGESGDAGGLVHALTVKITSNPGRYLRCVRCVDADAHLWRKALGLPMLRQCPLDRNGAAQRFLRALEAYKEAISGGDDFLAVVSNKEGPQG